MRLDTVRRPGRSVSPSSNGVLPPVKFVKQNWLTLLIAVLAVAGGAYYYWHSLQGAELGDGIAMGNGRIEAVEIDVASKTAGRLEEVFVDEGDFVTAGQKLAQLDTDQLEAQLRQAEAQARRAEVAIETARALVTQREAEKRAAEAAVAQRQVQLGSSERTLARSEQLRATKAISEQGYEDAKAAAEGARAAVAAAEASSAAADAGISYANAQIIDAGAALDAAKAAVDNIRTQIDESTLTSPRDGRVQFRIVQPGEIVAAGGKILNLVDVSQVHMSFFLPTEQVGRLPLGAEARIRLDAAPNLIIPAKVSFVANVAQFTPKTVETEIERQKLMFRVKARIEPALLKKYVEWVKTGLPGVAYVRLDPAADWPEAVSGDVVK